VSIQAVAWVLDHSRARGFARLVLISLANHANRETGECWPSMRTIAREAGIGHSSVTAAVRVLVALGELEIVSEGGPRQANRYRLSYPQRPGDGHNSVQELNAASIPGPRAASSPGLDRTIINRQEPLGVADKFCVRCQGRGRYWNAAGGFETTCPCVTAPREDHDTRPLERPEPLIAHQYQADSTNAARPP